MNSENLPETQGDVDGAALPPVVERATFQGELDELRVKEKAHTRAGDAIAAARRRLPMVEVDAATALTGPDGPLTLLDAFEGRRQLIAYYHMWFDGQPAAEQCEGCTFFNGQVREHAVQRTPDRPVAAHRSRALRRPPERRILTCTTSAFPASPTSTAASATACSRPRSSSVRPG
jgi:hypothetical protein